MEYTLMHKTIEVANITMLPEDGVIIKVNAVHAPAHLPVGTHDPAGKDKPNRAALNEWWRGRSIPASRDGLESALLKLGIHSAEFLITKAYGLSLSDHYWVRPQGTTLEWHDINFFENDFSRDIGEVLFGHAPARDLCFMSPDNTSDGWLQKKWVISGSKRLLMKGGSGGYLQEPFNELIATTIMRRLGINHIPYSLTFDDDKPYSLCETFTTHVIELVPAWRIVQVCKKSNNHSDLTHLLRCCEHLCISGVQESLDKMMVLDYIIANTDRHYNNFGFIRNSETLEWLGFSPIFDSGTSLWHDTQYVGGIAKSKPFKDKHSEQIKLVKSLDWFNSSALQGVEDEIISILAQSKTIDSERAYKIAETVKVRISSIEH